ncbi:anthranilate phosphoribosyltransferase [Thoreauomyces humboldtii]|nr:anthranilate phosphoribosyltransferase [Thoreauomyces humboldtii]
MANAFTPLIKALAADPTAFTAPQARLAAVEIMAGHATPAQVGAFLMLLKASGLESDAAVIAAFAAAMRDAAVQISFGKDEEEGVVDIVGTGGDGLDTFNVSTAAGIVAAGAGCRVAKHGNRASSSACGSADVLEALDCHLTSVTAEAVPKIIAEGGFCFLFSQKFHPSMKHVAVTRKELGVRTIFNLLGPLSSPALPKRIVVGVHSKSLGPLMAEALRLSGVERAWVVCGDMGLDEIAPEGKTHVWSLERNGEVTVGIVTPSDFGLAAHPLTSVVGGGPSVNAATMVALLNGELPEGHPILNFVLLNAGALLYVSGKAKTLPEAAQLAAKSIQDGSAKKALAAFAAAKHWPSGAQVAAICKVALVNPFTLRRARIRLVHVPAALLPHDQLVPSFLCCGIGSSSSFMPSALAPAARAPISAMKIPHIPGLSEQPIVAHRLLNYPDVTFEDVEWLKASAQVHECSPTAADTPTANTPPLRHVGLDTEFDEPEIGLIQLATETRCLLVKSPSCLVAGLFADTTIRKTGCELTKDAILLYSNFGHMLRAGIDITHLYFKTCLAAQDRSVVKGLFSLFSTMYLPILKPLQKDKVTTTSKWVGSPLTLAQLRYGILDAWVSYKVGVHDLSKISGASVLDLTAIARKDLRSIVDGTVAVLAVENMETKGYESKFSTVKATVDGNLEVVNTQFRNKLMFDDKVVLHNATNVIGTGTVLLGRHGKTKTVKPDLPLGPLSVVTKITVSEPGSGRGWDDFRREAFTKLVLHNEMRLSDIPLFGAVFQGKKWIEKSPPVYDLSEQRLNDSQKAAVEQRPPPMAVSINSTKHENFYVLTCQTNAATKNLAVTLLKRGVTDFRILVSDVFFVEWHEPQYSNIRDHVIQTSETSQEGFADLIGPRMVVLCSLAQLSNPRLSAVLIARQVTHIVLDEASQVRTADIGHVMALYKDSLQRMTFIGDPKQLAPYGNEQHPAVESVFEILRPGAMLKEQYWMPHDLGSFISANVYAGKLTSYKPRRDETSIALVDVS